MKTDPGERLLLLDGLRGFAAIGVLVFHARLSAPFPAFTRGYLFVDLFFLLSGFVLTLAFEPRFGAGIDAITFLRRRFRRFLPMVAAGAIPGAFALFGATSNGGLALAAFALSLAMVPMLTGGMTFPANTPQWSLFAELALNLLHGMKLHRLTDAKLVLLALACLAGLIMLMARAGDGDLGGDLRQLPAGLLRGGWSYLLGIVMARRWRARRPASAADWRIALLMPIAVVALLPLVPMPVWIGDALVISLGFPPLFWIAATAIPPRIAERPLALLGSLSFPLYAVHFPILMLASQLGGGERGRLFGIFPALLAAGILALSSATSRRTAPYPRASARDETRLA
ncbi:acyltransferase family protein [Novosphingobium lindaniclasticum]